MFARVSTLQGSPGSVEAGTVAVREQVAPAVQGMDGFKGMLALADASTGKMVAITLWETEDALRASEAAATGLRESTAGSASAEVAGVERFEVVFDSRS